MKPLFTLGLFSLYLAALLAPLYPVLDYTLNKDYAASKSLGNSVKAGTRCMSLYHLLKLQKKAGEQSTHVHAVQIVTTHFVLPCMPVAPNVSFLLSFLKISHSPPV